MLLPSPKAKGVCAWAAKCGTASIDGRSVHILILSLAPRRLKPCEVGTIDAPDDSRQPVDHCALCGSPRADAVLTAACPEDPQQTFPLVCCRDCGLGYLSRRPTPERLGDYYPADYYSFGDLQQPRSHRLKVALWRRVGIIPSPQGQPRPWLWRRCHDLFRLCCGPRARWLLPAETSGRCFLDVGCGAGARLDRAAQLGWVTYGLDLGERAVAAAAGRGHRVAVGSAEHLPFPTASMHLVMMSHVLEHLADPLQALREARRVLAPEGLLSVAVPNFGSGTARLYGEHWRALDVPRHLQHFTPQTLRQAATQAGLRVRSLHTRRERWVFSASRTAAGASLPPSAVETLRWLLRSLTLGGETLEMWCSPD